METSLFRFETSLVGCRHYPNSPPKVGSYVEFVREPTNPYDRFAIAVVALRTGEKYGHVPRDIAKKLAPVIDDCNVTIIAKYGGEFDGFSGILRVVVASLNNNQDSEIELLLRKIGNIDFYRF